MSGLSFISSGFLLAGAAAAALPIVIHLLLRPRAQMMPIGSVRFLQDVVRQHTRRRKIWQWILLGLRVLAILLLALLFARPYWDRSAMEGLNREVVLLIDRSASMQVKDDGGATVFSDALQAAQRELAALDENTAIHVALYDAGGVEQIQIDRLSEAKSWGDGDLKASDAASDHGVAFAWAQDIVTVSPRTNRQVVLITDLQRSGLNRTLVEGFDDAVDVVIRDVGRSLVSNVGVEFAEAVDTEIRPGEPVRVAVRVRNSGAIPVQGLQVKLALNGPGGAMEKTSAVDIAGGQRRLIDFACDGIQQDGVYRGRVSIAHDDDLELDNTRWLAFEARRPDRLLLVDGQEERSVYANETYYLETALRLRMPAASAPLRSFEVERIVWEDGDGFPRLDGFRAIVMANIRRLGEDDARRLQEYVRGGGNLLFFCGDQTTPTLMSSLRMHGLFPASIAREPRLGSWRIDQWDRQHPALIPFAEPQAGDLRRIRFERIVEFTDVAPEANVVMQSDGRPILLEQKLGEGVALFFATAADMEWSRWPQSRLYVPLMRQLTAYLTSQLSHRLPVVQQFVSQGTAGIYEEDEQTVARNTNPAESRLERATEEELRLALNLPERQVEAVMNDAASTLEAPPGVERPNEAWDLVIWLLFALLSIELLLASRVHS